MNFNIGISLFRLCSHHFSFIQVPDLDAVLVPVGGGGLIAGIAVAIKHLKPNVKIIVSKTI